MTEPEKTITRIINENRFKKEKNKNNCIQWYNNWMKLLLWVPFKLTAMLYNVNWPPHWNNGTAHQANYDNWFLFSLMKNWMNMKWPVVNVGILFDWSEVFLIKHFISTCFCFFFHSVQWLSLHLNIPFDLFSYILCLLVSIIKNCAKKMHTNTRKQRLEMFWCMYITVCHCWYTQLCKNKH